MVSINFQNEYSYKKTMNNPSIETITNYPLAQNNELFDI